MKGYLGNIASIKQGEDDNQSSSPCQIDMNFYSCPNSCCLKRFSTAKKKGR